MCRSNGSRVCGSERGAGRVVRDLIVVASAGRSEGRSPSVFTVQRSTPQVARPVAADVGGGADAHLATKPATTTRVTATAIRELVDKLTFPKRPLRPQARSVLLDACTTFAQPRPIAP